MAMGEGVKIKKYWPYLNGSRRPLRSRCYPGGAPEASKFLDEGKGRFAPLERKS